MKIGDVLQKVLAKELKQTEAAVILGFSERHIRRLLAVMCTDGPAHLVDHRRGKPPANRIPEAEVSAILTLYRTEYADYNARHFHEALVAHHGYKVSYAWVKQALHSAGLRQRHARRTTYRRRRERKPMRGMMVHLDASTHAWLPGEAKHDLLALVDDATGEILALQLADQESTASVLEILHTGVQRCGSFGSLYTDRASHFVYTPKAGEPPDRSKRTQVQQVLDELGIELICAYSPQARGRSERMWRTLQGRLPQELRRAGITSLAAANPWLEGYRVRFNQRFAVAPARAESAFLPVPADQLQRIFALRFERVVALDHTVRFQGQLLQLPKPHGIPTLARKPIEVRVALDGSIALFRGIHPLAFERITQAEPPLPEAA